jgi:FlaA1/EpsC-like NDP-sugar epimerase
MNRLIFTKKDAANLVKRTIEHTQKYGGGFVKSYKMKCVNMLDLANMINDGNIEIVGKRPGEKTNEDLISEREISRTYIYGDDIHIESKENTGDNKLNEPYNSKSAEKMSTLEMRDLIWG